MPRMPLIGVRISWLIVVRKRDLASLAASARSRAFSRFLEPPELVAQRFVLGRNPCRAHLGLAPGAGDRRGERKRQRDHRAGLNPERMNPEIRQAGAQIHSQSRPVRPRADPLCGPSFQAAVAIPLRNSAQLYGSASIPASRRGGRAVRRAAGYESASAICARPVGPTPSRSASVRASLSTRW